MSRRKTPNSAQNKCDVKITPKISLPIIPRLKSDELRTAYRKPKKSVHPINRGKKISQGWGVGEGGNVARLTQNLKLNGASATMGAGGARGARTGGQKTCRCARTRFVCRERAAVGARSGSRGSMADQRQLHPFSRPLNPRARSPLASDPSLDSLSSSPLHSRPLPPPCRAADFRRLPRPPQTRVFRRREREKRATSGVDAEFRIVGACSVQHLSLVWLAFELLLARILCMVSFPPFFPFYCALKG